MNLASASFLYRHPDLYDLLGAEPDDHTARECENLIKEHGLAGASSVLDLGCGTGRHLTYLAARFPTCTGVDIQPDMIAHGRQIHPHLDLRIGDIREVRLGETFDAICCLGYAIAYLHTYNDLQAAFTTFAAHAHPGTLLILDPLLRPSALDTPTTSRVALDGRYADVTTSYDWDPHTRTTTMHRRWHIDNGDEITDTIQRRVTSPDELRQHLDQAGFEPIDQLDEQTRRLTARRG